MTGNSKYHELGQGFWPALRAHAAGARGDSLVFVSVYVDDRHRGLPDADFNVGIQAVCEDLRLAPRSTAIIDDGDAGGCGRKQYFVAFGGAMTARRFERHVNEARPAPFRSASIRLEGSAPLGPGH